MFQDGALVAKNHAPEVIPQAGSVFRVGGGAKTLSKLKEFFLFVLSSLDPLVNQLDDNPVGTESPLFREGSNVPRCIGRKAHGLANDFV